MTPTVSRALYHPSFKHVPNMYSSPSPTRSSSRKVHRLRTLTKWSSSPACKDMSTVWRRDESTQYNSPIRHDFVRSFSSRASTESIKSREAATGTYLVSKYQQMFRDGGGTTYDPHQIRALNELDRLRNELVQNQNGGGCGRRHGEEVVGQDEERESNHFASPVVMDGFFNKLFSSFPATSVSTAPEATSPRGVYLHGGVGCGKTFCMDLFYESIVNNEGVDDDGGGDEKGNEGINVKAQKVHFHSFMLNKVHKQMHEAKMVEGMKGDVLPRVIERILDDGHIICFDEFQVTDVADALILRRLFTGLLKRGAVIVATSNRPPHDLYLNGLQRDRFLPFIDLLEEKLSVVSMWESDTDYRLIQGETAAHGVYFVGDSSKAEFEEMFTKLTKGEPVGPTSLLTQGRRVLAPIASIEQGVARFVFDDLCRKAMGAADYIVIGENFHTVFVEGVPSLTLNDVNVVRRLITFIDCMYEAHVKLILQLRTLPKDIFVVDLNNKHHDEAFAFDRSRSRLEEMGSKEYLGRKWVGRGKEVQDKELSEDLEYLHEDDIKVGEEGHLKGRHIRRHPKKSQGS